MSPVKLLATLLLILIADTSSSHGNRHRQTRPRVGPIYPPTNGQPWPMPQYITNLNDEPLLVSPALLNFQSIGLNCDVLELAFRRYYEIILKTTSGLLKNSNSKLFYKKEHQRSPNEVFGTFADYLDILYINVTDVCEDWPHENMDESYVLNIVPAQAVLIARSNWGALRGLETFSQIIHSNSDRTALQINSTLIEDYPRFPYRSLLLDSSRHFLPKKLIYENLELMSMNKLNVLHWHITDNEAFPFRSERFPQLSARGSYHQFTHEYTKQDVRDIIDYARVLGIRVIPEFDTPGHTDSWLGQPGFVTPCYSYINETDTWEPNGKFGPVDPSNEENYEFLRSFFTEVTQTFPENFIHLGGDEVEYNCWRSNPNVRAFMEQMEFSDDYSLLEDYHMSRMVEIIKSFQDKNRTTIGWQEVFFNNQAADPDMIVHIWILEELYEQIYNVTAAGYKLLLGSCWYLDHISYGSDWRKYYLCDPHNFTGTDEQKALVLGGGPNMWAEYIDATNLIPLLWPRAAVPAERLWSAQNINDTVEAAYRLEEHRCRLVRRGYNAQPPNGAGFCLGESY